VTEWLKVTVLKTVVAQATAGSNPVLSASLHTPSRGVLQLKGDVAISRYKTIFLLRLITLIFSLYLFFLSFDMI
jgi:hypothetical protein